MDPPCPVHALRVGVGLGKSTAARRHGAIRLLELRAAGDRRTIVIAVPTAKLGHEQVAKFLALPEARGLIARVRLGRERPDPEHPDFADPTVPDKDKTRMCRDLDAVADAQEAMLDVQSAVCRQRNPDGSTAECPHYSGCGYQRQRQTRADLWFLAHEHLFLEKPIEIGDPVLVIVDEAPWDAGLIGHDGHHISLPLDTVRHGDTTIQNDSMATARLDFLRIRLADVFDAHPDGPLNRPALVAAGFNVANAGEARALEWRRKVEVKMWPGMPRGDRKEAAKAAKANKTIWRLARLWRAVAALVAPDGPKASGWAHLALEEAEEGTVRMLRLKGRREVAEGWRKPTLLIDATLQVELIQPFWPAVEVTADIAVATPHQHVRQVGDLTFSKQQLSHVNAMNAVHAIVCRETRRHAPGEVLAVLQADPEARLKGRGHLPANVATAHHNAIAGRDEWREVTALIVVGRTAPSPWAVERQAEAMTGQAIEPVEGWYPAASVAREMTDGRWTTGWADRHPHPIAEAMRWHATEGELLQIIGRARGADRTAANPVDVLMMCNTVIPIPVERLLNANDLAPSVVDRMLAAGGVALFSHTDAARAYPELWTTHAAARMAFKRGGFEHLLIDNYLSRNVRNLGLVVVRYQPAGVGKKPAVAWFDLALVPDPRTWLTDRLGPLSRFEMVEPVVSPELAARAMARMTDADRLALRAMLRPSPPDYRDGAVPLVPGGYGDPPRLFPGMKATRASVITNVVTIRAIGLTVIQPMGAATHV